MPPRGAAYGTGDITLVQQFQMQAFAEPEGLILAPDQVGRDGQLLKVRGLEWPLPISG